MGKQWIVLFFLLLKEKFRLKYVQNGYYKCVTEFTPKLLSEQIESLFNIETNIGRGRAWFFLALNDSLTESYIKCFQDNRKLVKKFYTSDSIVNDTQVRFIHFLWLDLYIVFYRD
jgi:pleckstrin family protein M 2